MRITVEPGPQKPLRRYNSQHAYLRNRAYCMDLFNQLTVGLKEQQQLKMEFVDSLTQLQLLKGKNLRGWYRRVKLHLCKLDFSIYLIEYLQSSELCE